MILYLTPYTYKTFRLIALEEHAYKSPVTISCVDTSQTAGSIVYCLMAYFMQTRCTKQFRKIAEIPVVVV